jgi:outer membrane receptor for ferrienterochelin and colicins
MWLVSPLAWAHEPEMESVPPIRAIEDLDLAALLDQQTAVATKLPGRVSQSPGMVTVHGEGDLRRMGYYTLADLADVTVGYSSYTIYGERVFETRGQKAGSFNNNKHLVLIDGIPVNHARGNKAMIEENLPLFFASRVEFLKGPTSALYGTGAFFGVVDVVPKALPGPGLRMEGRAGMGTRQQDKTVMGNVLYQDERRSATLAVGHYEKGPSRAFVGQTDDPDNRYWDDQDSTFLYMSYGVESGLFEGAKAGLLYSAKTNGLGEHWLGTYSPEYNDQTWTQALPFLKYDRQLGQRWSVDGYAKVHEDTQRATAASLSSGTSSGEGPVLLVFDGRITTYEGLAELRCTPVSALDLIAGGQVNVNHQHRGDSDYVGFISADPGPVYLDNPNILGKNDLFQTWSVFGQSTGRLPVLRGLSVTGGARLDTGQAKDDVWSHLSPRVGVVQMFTDALGLKLLYSTALRAPGNKEIGLNSEQSGLLADPSDLVPLEPESIRSLEAGLSWNSPHISASAAAFVNETRDALDGTPVQGKSGDPLNIFANSKGVTVARGTEVEVTGALNADTRVFANHAYARALYFPTGESSGQELVDVPVHKLNVGASYRLPAPIDLTAEGIGKYVSGYRTGEEPPLPPSLVLDANLVWRLSSHTALELMGRNLLGQSYKLPKNGLPDVPMPDRSVHATLDVRW